MNSTVLRQFSTETKIKIIKLIPVIVTLAFGPSGQTKLVKLLKFFILISAEISL